jgi:NAD(P)-dependent dehydrogenase (short-subunit alcohol dehydrogenase family)
MHRQGRPTIDFTKKGIEHISYSDSKFYVLMLSLIVARKWEDVYSNVVDPGWVPTKMGGKSAPENLDKGYETQVWLAESEDSQAKVSGRYFYHKTESKYKSEAGLISLQEEFINACQDISGIKFSG